MSAAGSPVIVRTPLRLSLGGGGTDLPYYSDRHGGDLLTVALAHYVTVVVQSSPIDGLYRFSHDTTAVAAATARRLEAPFARAALAMLDIDTPCSITSFGPVPAGTGLGSSGAFSVSLLAALAELDERRVTRTELAELGWGLEAGLLERPVGRQDHYACALGGLRRLRIDHHGRAVSTTADVTPEARRELREHLLLFYTGLRRDSAEQLAAPAEGRPLQNRIADLHEIKKIGREIGTALERGDVPSVGALLHEHWLVKRTSERTPFFDDCYHAARRGGATGGKLVGAGGGGFLLLFAAPERHAAVRAALHGSGLTPVPFTFDLDGTAIARTADAWEALA
jgi:D-glycero-alpha-D-manno-heptose-7-phosphate kinase